MSEQRRVFKEAERHLYVPPNCSGCGIQVEQEWLQVGTSWNPDQWMPGLWRCNTVGCENGPPMVEVIF